MTQVPLIDDGHVEKLEREREFEVDLTPGPVVKQGLWWLANYFMAAEGRPPRMFVDPCAGAGVFGQRARAAWPDIETIGVEPRTEEQASARHYDWFLRQRIEDAAARVYGDRRPPAVDITATNPAFSIWPTVLRLAYPRSKWTMLYGTIAWGCCEGADDDGNPITGAALFHEFPPFACGRVVGRVHHRGPGLNPKTGRPWGADQRDVCWWLWKRGHTGPVWFTENLPVLPAHDRKWIVRPGDEP